MSSPVPRCAHQAHPCFYAGARGKYGRIHLPVAPACNIECAYCRRDCDCPHESRPGVASRVIGPEEAWGRLEAALKEMPQISVAAIAGPGDAFCDPERTLRTFELIRRHNSEIALCVSSNGLNIRDYIPCLRDLGVGYVTITVNAVDPKIGMRLHRSAVLDGRRYAGIEAASLLLARQLEALGRLKAAGITVKVNTVVVPGVNDGHVLFLTKRLERYGVDLMNFLPLIPLPGTELESACPPTDEFMRKLRLKASQHVQQMHHCNRCRSDAAGLLRFPHSV